MFKKGKYKHVMRMVYKDQLMMGVHTKILEKFVRLALKKLAGIKFDRLSSACFAR